MSARLHRVDIDRLRAVYLIELIIWALCAALTIAVGLSTLASSFPARQRALIGEAIALDVAIVLSLFALARMVKAERADPRLPARSALVRGAAFAALRVMVGVPVFLFGLVASAAGFAA